jgi:hypothetical protein
MGIFITFSISILMIYSLMNMKKQILRNNKNLALIILSIIIFIASLCMCYYLNERFHIDYGFYGCLLALFPAIFHHDNKGSYQNRILKKLDNKYVNVFMLAIGIILLAKSKNHTQYYALLSLPFLLLYSGKRGKYNMKYFFYIFYPVHLVIIYLISFMI